MGEISTLLTHTQTEVVRTYLIHGRYVDRICRVMGKSRKLHDGKLKNL
jgi:hypothetical protein